MEKQIKLSINFSMIDKYILSRTGILEGVKVIVKSILHLVSKIDFFLMIRVYLLKKDYLGT